MSRTQTLVQLTGQLVARLDERAARDRRSRSSLIREAIEQYLHDEEEAEIDRQIVEGYSRVPPTPEEEDWALRSAADPAPGDPW